jgi:glycerol-3-phosphate dehydrogenase
MTQNHYDVFIIGGGINGAGIARDAQGRGLSVYLCEKGDLANGTSSASSKMIHGGLRYLEFYEFRLVREALHEREVLLNSAPHIIWPIEFVLPHSPSLRSSWLVRAGLFLYDHLAKRKRLAGSYSVDLTSSRFGKPLKRFVKSGFVYSDCWVEDARLVVLNALDAAKKNAQIHPHTEFVKAVRGDKQWQITVRHQHGREETLTARHIVNAGGPGLRKVAERIEGVTQLPLPLHLVKGSHIVVPRLYEGEHAYILQHSDRRMVFVIPFEEDFTMIGTTDQNAEEADLAAPKISQYELDYLLEAVNLYFTKQLTRYDVRYTYSGIRPLFDDGEQNVSKVTRDYKLVLADDCLSVYGGKITTFRRLAEEAVDLIVADRDEDIDRPRWTQNAVLPGGDIGSSLSIFTKQVIEAYPFLPENLAARLASHYGTRVHQLLEKASSMADMGMHFGYDLYAREVDFLCKTEWASQPDDILLRRTKIGLHTDPATREKLADYLAGGPSKL